MRRICRVGLELLAQLEDLVIHGTRRGIDVIPPHLIEQELAGENVLGVLDEELEELELVGGEDDGFAETPGAHALEVDLAVAEAEGGGGDGLVLAADGGLHAGHELT